MRGCCGEAIHANHGVVGAASASKDHLFRRILRPFRDIPGANHVGRRTNTGADATAESESGKAAPEFVGLALHLLVIRVSGAPGILMTLCDWSMYYATNCENRGRGDLTERGSDQ